MNIALKRSDGGEGMLEYICRFLIGSSIKSKEVEWTGIKTQEGKNKFVDLVYKTYPAAEKIYQGNHGGGIPTPSSVVEYLESKK
jgi:hypothetical protein